MWAGSQQAPVLSLAKLRFVNAWIRQYEVSQDAAYLKQADAIVRALLEQVHR